MNTTKKKSKHPNRHEQVAQLMLDGTPVATTTIKKELGSLSYKISTYMLDIKLDGGIIKTEKQGRNVLSYQLLNPHQFSDTGRFQKNA